MIKPQSTPHHGTTPGFTHTFETHVIPVIPAEHHPDGDTPESVTPLRGMWTVGLTKAWMLFLLIPAV